MNLMNYIINQNQIKLITASLQVDRWVAIRYENFRHFE